MVIIQGKLPAILLVALIMEVFLFQHVRADIDSDNDGMPDSFENQYSGEVMFEDHFEDGTLDPAWVMKRTYWEEADGKLKTVPEVLPGFNYGHSGNGRSPLIVLHEGDSTWTDYSYEFTSSSLGMLSELSPQGVPINFQGGITSSFRVKEQPESWNEPANYLYSFSIRVSDGGIYGNWKAEDWYLRGNEGTYIPGTSWNPNYEGTKYIFAEENSPAINQGSQQNHVNILVKGNKMYVWVNGVFITEAMDSLNISPYGGISFSSLWEVMAWYDDVIVRKVGLNPNLPDAHLDYDNDGFTNLEEYQNGTNPMVAGSSSNDGLLVYFSFDKEPVNGVVADESGNGNDATVVGTPSYEPEGVFGGAYSFTAKSGSSCCSWYRDYITLSDNPTAEVDELTVSLWSKTNSPSNNYKIASAAYWSPGSGWVLGAQYPEIWGDSSGTKVFDPRSNCYLEWENSILEAGKWNHIVISYSGTRFQQFINGKLVNDCPGSGEKVGDARGQKLVIGAWPQHGFGYDGFIDEFRVYNRGISAEEVIDLYNDNGISHSDCKHAIYSPQKRTLTIPFVEIPVVNFLTGQSTSEMELWKGTVKQVLGTTNRFRIISKDFAQITDGSSSSCPATYVIETGTLSIPYIDIPTGITVGNKDFGNEVDVFSATMIWDQIGKSFVVQEVKQIADD